MSTYVIGDVQGCFESLEKLLATVRFDARRDRLCFVGDLVNRGPRSLEVLRFVRGLGERATVVLGNHDLYLLQRYYARVRKRARDTLDPVLAARDTPQLLDWLRRQPLIAPTGVPDRFVVHAGLLPSWSIEMAQGLAREVEAHLAAPGGPSTLVLAALDEKGVDRFEDDSLGVRRLAGILSVLTRVRCLRADETLCTGWKGPPVGAPRGCRPWFVYPSERPTRLVFGHWAALGIYADPRHNALDSGCVWGQKLTALRLEDDRLFQVDSVEGGTVDDD